MPRRASVSTACLQNRGTLTLSMMLLYPELDISRIAGRPSSSAVDEGHNRHADSKLEEKYCILLFYTFRCGTLLVRSHCSLPLRRSQTSRVSQRASDSRAVTCSRTDASVFCSVIVQANASR